MSSDELTLDEILTGGKVGKHIVKNTIQVIHENNYAYCECPKFDETNPIGYGPRMYNVYGTCLFEIPADSILMRPFRNHLGFIDTLRTIFSIHVTDQSLLKLTQGETPKNTFEKTNCNDLISHSIRTNKIIFKGIQNYSRFLSFTKKEKKECKCYPFAERKIRDRMMRIDSEITHTDENFDDPYHNGYTSIIPISTWKKTIVDRVLEGRVYEKS